MPKTTHKTKSVEKKRTRDIRPKDLLRTLEKLDKIAISNTPLQKKVDLMNLEMLRILKPTAIN